MTEPDPRVDARPRAIFLMGPTASGKTALAIELAQRFGVALISVDSALVYRGLDVGSAKPDAETLRRVPHRLIDVREPEQSYSAAEFRADALREMAAIAAGGGVPLLVGGTGLYFRALERGLSELPQADAALRARLDREREAIGLGALHARLAALDPAAAARIHANDPQRIQRALEVIELSGRPLSEQQGRRGPRLAYRVLKLVVAPAERAVLHARIETRFRAMLDAGLLDELRRLRARPQLRADHPSMRAVGYRQAWQHLDGEFDAPTLLARGIHATRQLAKRQLTWLRGEHDAFWLDPTASDAAARLQRLLVGHLARPSACGH
jgi:tRNA dimethylallyltransferase